MKKIWKEILFILLALLVLSGIVFSDFLGLNLFSPEVEEEVHIPEYKFGLPVDSFHIIEGKVLPSQNLGDILTGYGVNLIKIDQVSRQSKGVFDLRKIKAGQNYYLFQSHDSARTLRYLVYENNPVDYVLFNLTDSITISLGRKDVHLVNQTASGTIKSSLWNTMTENNLNPVLALDLSDIFAWTIDFFGLQKGDRFRAYYEEQFVDTVSIGHGPILAAQFDHMGKSYFAFRFFQDGRFDYFDENGQSLRKAFLKAPLSFSRISSHFTASRFHPVLKIRRPHFGVDYAARKGTPVVTIGDGTVVERKYQGGAGNYVRIKHNTTYSTTYMHLSKFGPGIASGSRVKQGQVIGYVGSTGLSTGPHLDFRVFKNGTPVDPLKIEAPPTEPVRKDLRIEFNSLKDSLTAILQKKMWSETVDQP